MLALGELGTVVGVRFPLSCLDWNEKALSVCKIVHDFRRGALLQPYAGQQLSIVIAQREPLA